MHPGRLRRSRARSPRDRARPNLAWERSAAALSAPRRPGGPTHRTRWRGCWWCPDRWRGCAWRPWRPRLVRPVDGEVHRLEQRGLERRIAEQAECVARHGAVVARALQRIGQRIVSLDQTLRALQVVRSLVELLQRAPPELAVDPAAAQEGQDHRQRDLAFAEIVAHRLAELGLTAGI